MTTFTEGRTPGEAIVSEASGNRSRDVAVVTGLLKAGAVLGQRRLASATSAAKAGGNTGNGTFVLDATTPVLAAAIAGIYRLRCIEAVANGGIFRLEDPNGIVLGDVTIPAGAGNSVTVNEHIKGALTDAGTDFVVGDGFDITVAAGDGKYVELAPAAIDGSQVAAAVLWAGKNVSGDEAAAIIVRDAEIATSHLVWPTGITDNQKAAALAQLKLAGLIAR